MLNISILRAALPCAVAVQPPPSSQSAPKNPPPTPYCIRSMLGNVVSSSFAMALLRPHAVRPHIHHRSPPSFLFLSVALQTNIGPSQTTFDMAEVVRNIRSSFDLWCGVSSELSSVSCGISKPQQRHSLQLEPQMHFSGSQLCDSADQLLTSDTTELLMLLQQQQASTDAEAETPSADELGIDAQIKRLLELKQFLRRTKATTGQQQQQQVILEDVALAYAANALDAATAASASGLFCSSGLVTPLQSERYVEVSDTRSDSPCQDVTIDGWLAHKACCNDQVSCPACCRPAIAARFFTAC